MLLFSVDRCASCPGQLLAIPKVARETLQWKILGNLRVPARRGSFFRLKPETNTILVGLQEAPPPPARVHTSCIFPCVTCAPGPPLDDGGFTKFSSDMEVSGRSAKKKNPQNSQSVREKIRWSGAQTSTPNPTPHDSVYIDAAA